jgi:hypothetical protein
MLEVRGGWLKTTKKLAWTNPNSMLYRRFPFNRKTPGRERQRNDLGKRPVQVYTFRQGASLNSLPSLVVLRSRFGQRLGRLGYLAWIAVTGLSFLGLTALVAGERTLGADPEPVRRALVTVLVVVFSVIRAYLSVRRLHDLNWSGWWYLLVLLLPLPLPAPYGQLPVVSFRPRTVAHTWDGGGEPVRRTQWRQTESRGRRPHT